MSKWLPWNHEKQKKVADQDLLERELTEEDWKFYNLTIDHFKSVGYAKTIEKLYPDTVKRFVMLQTGLPSGKSYLHKLVNYNSADKV